MKAYSMDLRERIVGARRVGEGVESVAKRFGVCTKTVRTYEKRVAQGCLSPTPRPGRAPRLNQDDHAALRTLVQERTDWTLATLSQAWHERGGQELPSSKSYPLPRVTLFQELPSSKSYPLPRSMMLWGASK